MNIIVALVVTFEEEVGIIHIIITITGEGIQGEIIVEVVIHMVVVVEEEDEEVEDGGMIMEGVVCHHPGEGIIIIIFIKVAAAAVEFQKEKEIFMEGIMEDNIHLTRRHPNVNNKEEGG